MGMQCATVCQSLIPYLYLCSTLQRSKQEQMNGLDPTSTSNYTSGYPWSDLIRLNDFSLALSLIAFFYLGSQGQLLLSQVLSRDKTFGVAWYAKCPKCRSILSGAFDLDQSICFVLDYPTGGMLYITRCLGAFEL